MVQAELESIRVNLSSNAMVTKQVKEDLKNLEKDGTDTDVVAKKIKLSTDLMSMNNEQIDLTAKLHDLLHATSTVVLADRQSDCDRIIASTKEKYAEELSSINEKTSTISEQAEQVTSEQEAADMEFADTDAKITAELDALREREAQLREELDNIEKSIADLEERRQTAASSRDGTAVNVGTRLGQIDLSSAQVSTTQEAMKLEVAAVNEVEKVLDDVFDEVARDIKDKYDTVSGESTRLTSSGLLLLETHIGYVKVALESLQQKIGFCSSELHERIEKRESMIKMGMENVADSLIPGFDKLEEKFIELVQSMKSLVGDFEPIASVAVGAETSAADDADAELRARIVAGVASVQKLTVALEQAASMLEGKIEMEEGKWHGRAAKAELSPPDAVGAGPADVDAIVADISSAQD